MIKNIKKLANDLRAKGELDENKFQQLKQQRLNKMKKVVILAIIVVVCGFGNGEMVFSLFIGALLIAIFYYETASYYYKQIMLHHSGTKTLATVNSITGYLSYTVSYVFEDKNGNIINGKSHIETNPVKPDISFNIGDKIEIFYLERNPELNTIINKIEL